MYVLSRWLRRGKVSKLYSLIGTRDEKSVTIFFTVSLSMSVWVRENDREGESVFECMRTCWSAFFALIYFCIPERTVATSSLSSVHDTTHRQSTSDDCCYLKDYHWDIFSSEGVVVFIWNEKRPRGNNRSVPCSIDRQNRCGTGKADAFSLWLFPVPPGYWYFASALHWYSLLFTLFRAQYRQFVQLGNLRKKRCLSSFQLVERRTMQRRCILLPTLDMQTWFALCL